MSKKTEKQIVGKVVEKAVPCIVFNDVSLLMLLMGIVSATFAEIIQVTGLSSFRKTNNRFYDKPNKKWLVEKVSKINCALGTFYEKGVQKADGGRLKDTFKAQEHKWAVHYKGSKVVMINRKEEKSKNPEKYYAAVRPLRADEVTYRWVDSKDELTESEIVELKMFKPNKPYTPIQWRTVTVSNIREIKMGGIRHQRG